VPRRKNDKYYCIICSFYAKSDTRCVCCNLFDYRFNLSCLSMHPDDIVLLENWFCSVCACAFPFYSTSEYDVVNSLSSHKDIFSKSLLLRCNSNLFQFGRFSSVCLRSNNNLECDLEQLSKY
jgi:hypothetical protein